jgi:mRNA interferase YafQ
MRTINFTARFRKDFKRVQKSQPAEPLQTELQPVINLLVADASLPSNNRDHALQGQWSGYRDCHIRPDLVLIYRKFEPSALELTRLGSHSELFKK